MLAGFGLTDGQALSAVLAYRAVNFWLPIPFGGLAYASIELEHRAVRVRVKRRALTLQTRAVELVTRGFGSGDRRGAATADAEVPPRPQPVEGREPAPRTSTTPPAPHPGAGVALRAQAVDIDPAG